MSTSSATRRQRFGSSGGTSRNKRDAILIASSKRFGSEGYESTKWADVAADVGVGSTALYHYFESKLHCLFEIMADTLLAFRTTFNETTAGHVDFSDGMRALIHANFVIDEVGIARCRVLVAEHGRLSRPRTSEREEDTRQVARSHTRELKMAWSNYLSRGMAVGAIPEADPQLLTRAVLGLYNSIWHWYRPRGTLSLDEVEAFYAPRMLQLVGLAAEADA